MENAESSCSKYNEYYRFSPLGFLNDSYFTRIDPNAQYESQGFGNLEQNELGIAPWGGSESAPVPQCPALPSNQPYQLLDPMDLDVLSAENYHEGAYGRVNSSKDEGLGTQLYGGLLANDGRQAATPDPPPHTRSRRSSKKDASKNANTVEDNPRPRGRPRLDTRDQTAAQVSLVA